MKTEVRLDGQRKEADLLTIAVEVDVDPPNIASLKFNQKAGFVQIGTRKLDSGKCVSIQIWRLE